MSKKDAFVNAAIAGILALGATGTASADGGALPQSPRWWEACYGVSLTGMNDCGSLDGLHLCSGAAKSDFDPGEWIWVPRGTCVKLGGTVVGRRVRVKRAVRTCIERTEKR